MYQGSVLGERRSGATHGHSQHILPPCCKSVGLLRASCVPFRPSTRHTARCGDIQHAQREAALMERGQVEDEDSVGTQPFLSAPNAGPSKPLTETDGGSSLLNVF